MLEPIYRKEYDQSSLVFQKKQAEAGEYFQMQMLLENRMEGLLACSLHSFNGEEQIFFDISGKQALSAAYEKKQMKAADLELLLFGIKKALEKMREYLLDESYLLLSPEYIYINLSAEQLFLCFYPFEKREFAKSMAVLTEYLLERVDHEDDKAVVLAYRFYRLVREDNFSYMQIMDELFSTAAVKEDRESAKVQETEGQERDDIQMETDKVIINTEKKEPKYLFYAAICVMLTAIGYGGYTYYFSVLVIKDSFYDYAASGDFLLPFGGLIFGLILFGFSFFFYRISSQKQREERILEEITDQAYNDEFP